MVCLVEFSFFLESDLPYIFVDIGTDFRSAAARVI